MTGTLEIELNGPRNQNLFFRPLQRRLRGRLDFARDSRPLARMKTAQYPLPIPGQRLGIDLDNSEGFLVDPLHDAEHLPTRERIEASGAKLGPARESFPNVDAVTWLFWIKSAVDAGLAQVVSGKLPDKITGEPQTSFIMKREPSSSDRLTAAIERQTEVFEKLLAKLG